MRCVRSFQLSQEPPGRDTVLRRVALCPCEKLPLQSWNVIGAPIGREVNIGALAIVGVALKLEVSGLQRSHICDY